MLEQKNGRARRSLYLSVFGLGLVLATTLSQAHAQPAGPVLQPTPYPGSSIGPASAATTLPYPAYGTPAPGVGAGTPAPGVPQHVSLQQAITIGYARSPALASARADVGVAAAEVRLDRAGLLPSIAGSATTSRQYQQSAGVNVLNSSRSGATTGTLAVVPSPTPTPSLNLTAPRTITVNGLNAALTQLIYDGGRVASSVRAAQRNETSFADTYRRNLQTVAFNVATAYYNYLEAQRTTAVDVALVQQNQVQQDLVAAQLRAGTAARVDLATVEIPTAQARLALVRAQGAELAAQAAFANAMGLDAETSVQPVDDTSIAPGTQIATIAVPTYAQARARALALRPDYDASVQSVQSAQFSLRAAKLGLFPSLAATGQAGTNSTSNSGGDFRNASSIGLALTIPIYDQGLTAANTAEAQANLEKAQAALQSTKLGVQLNVKQALTNLVSAKAALDQTSVELNSAEIVLAATRAQYRAGVTTLPLLLNAQVQLTQALSDRVTSIYSLRLAEQQYLYATGEIGQI
jgi:outer membrane protein